MPGLARKVIICAAADGLVLHPLNAKKDQQQQQQRSSSLAPIRIKYGDASISAISRDAAPDLSSLPPDSSFEAFGIVGRSCPSHNAQLYLSFIVCPQHIPYYIDYMRRNTTGWSSSNPALTPSSFFSYIT
jgi:hypothetical protein